MQLSDFARIIGSAGLLIIGSYLFATGLSNLLLLPVALELASLSGAQAVAQVQIWQNQYITQLAFGVLCLLGSALVAFFRLETIDPLLKLAGPQTASPPTSKTANLTTEQLIAELRSRTPRN